MVKQKFQFVTHPETHALLKEMAAENQNSIGDELTFIVHLVAAMGEHYRDQNNLPKELYGSHGVTVNPRLTLAYTAARSAGLLDPGEIPGMSVVNPVKVSDDEKSNVV